MSGEMTVFKAGDVVRYDPDDSFSRWHCREGLAIAHERDEGRIVLCDTFWSSGSDNHVLSETEVASARLQFNRDDFESVRNELAWEQYAPSDRAVITSQHRLQAIWLVRKGAVKDLATQVENARGRLADAESKLESARFRVELARRDLADLTAPPVSSVLPVGGLDGGVR